MKQDVEAIISYWKDSGDGTGPDEEHDSEILFGHHEEENLLMQITDIRGSDSDYALDIQGFEPYTLQKKEGLEDPERATEHFEEVAEMIKSKTGAKHILIFGQVKRQLARGALEPREFRGRKIQAPSPRSHADFAPSNVFKQMQKRVPGAEELISSSARWQVLGLWKPMKTVQRDPLVLADVRSVPDSEFVDLGRDKTVGVEADWVVSTVRNSRKGEQLGHRWCYWSGMGVEEVLVLNILIR